nr:reverse transcriptase domain-containing protein [Tanacetum cinerariifolium]
AVKELGALKGPGMKMTREESEGVDEDVERIAMAVHILVLSQNEATVDLFAAKIQIHKQPLDAANIFNFQVIKRNRDVSYSAAAAALHEDIFPSVQRMSLLWVSYRAFKRKMIEHISMELINIQALPPTTENCARQRFLKQKLEETWLKEEMDPALHGYGKVYCKAVISFSRAYDGKWEMARIFHFGLKNRFHIRRGLEHKKVWNIKVMAKIKTFWWRVCSNALATRKKNLYKRNCSSSPLCQICNSQVETIEHVFFEWPWTKSVWFGSNYGLRAENLSGDFTSHMSSLIDIFPSKSKAIKLLASIAITSWNIWKSRNKFIFEHTLLCPSQVISASNVMQRAVGIVARDLEGVILAVIRERCHASSALAMELLAIRNACNLALFDENGVIRTKKYAELSTDEKIHVDCDMKATNIILQGLPADIYSLERECKLYDAFDKSTHIKGESLHTYYLRFTQLINDINIYKMKMEQFQVNTKFLNSLPPEWGKFVADVKLVKDLHTSNFDQLHAYLEQHEIHANEVRIMPMAFLTAVASSRFPSTNNQLRTSSNTRNQATIQDGGVTLQQVQGRQGQNYSVTTYKGNATSSKGNTTSGQAREKAILAEAQEDKQILDEEQLAFLADPGIPAGQAQTIIPQDAAFQTEDLNTYDSDSDDLSTTQAVLIANVSNYGSDVISEQETQQATVQDTNLQVQQDSMILSVNEQMFEQMINHVNNWKLANKEQNNKSITVELEIYKERVKTFEQRFNIDLSSHEKMIDSQMDDMIREKLALKEQVDSLEQNLSKKIKEKESLFKTFTIFQNESKEKENKYMENEINLEKKIKELDNVVYKVGQSAQTMHVLTKPQSFYDNVHKQALGYQNLFYLKKAQRIKPTLYDGIVIFEKHVAMPVIDDEETLILEEESRSKMSKKRVEVPSELPKVSLVNERLKKLKFQLAQFDSVVKKRTTPNALTEVFDQMEAVVQQSSVDKKCVEIANKELLFENDRLSQQIMSQDIVSTVMNCMSLNVDCMNSIDAGSHSGVYGRRFGINGWNTSNDMPGERHDMIEDDAGNALLYSTALGSIYTQRHSTISPCFFPLTISPSDNTIPTVLDGSLILTLEFGPGVTPGDRLTRVVPFFVGATAHQWPKISSNTGARNCFNKLAPSVGPYLLNYQEFRMTGPTPITPINQTNTNTDQDGSPDLQEQILSHISSLKALVQKHNESPTGLLKPIWLSFDNEGGPEEEHDEELKDLRKPYKEVLKSPFSRRIIEFSAPKHQTPTNLKIYDGSTDPDNHITRFVGAANQGEWEMPVWCRMFQQTLDRLARGWFDRLPNGCIDNWTDLREAFVERLDDFVKLEEVFKNTELPKGEHPERPTIVQFRGSRLPRHSYGSRPSRADIYRRGDHYQPYVTLQVAYERQRGGDRGRQTGINNGQRKVINMVWQSYNGLKRKSSYKQFEEWMDVPITFPLVSTDDLSDGPLIVEAEVEGYWIRRARLAPTQMELVGFSGEQLIPIGKTKIKESLPYAPKKSRYMSADGQKKGGGTRSIDKRNGRDKGPEHGRRRKGGVPRRLVRHAQNVNHSVPPIAQKRRALGTEKGNVVTMEVEEWVKARIVRPVKYPTWILNLVLVKKADDTWRMCIDFKNLNSACPKDYYPLPEIVLKIKAVIGYPFKCFLDAYKGYHQIQMFEEDEEKAAFYADQETNLEAYVDDMVIKSKIERDMIMDISETFDNLRNINMKLNPMRCSFGIGEGKFLGYMVTSEALNRFLYRSAERSFPFFKTLKNITKENKEDYRWTEEAERAFQELKKFILELPTLTTPELKETLFVYLATSHDTVRDVLVANRKGKQTPIRYVSRALHEAKRNYAPLEKLALCLLYLSRRLRRYLEAYLIKVITDQLVKQILNKPKVSGKLAKNMTRRSMQFSRRRRSEGMDFVYGRSIKPERSRGCTLSRTKNSTKDEGVDVGCSAKEQATIFKKFSIKNIPRNQNQKADVLSKLASVAFNHLTKEILVEVLNLKSVDVQEVSKIVEEEEDNWMTPIIKCLEEGVWPTDENEARTLRMKIGQYVVEDEVLLKKSYSSPMLRCVGLLQANYIIRKVHERACGSKVRSSKNHEARVLLANYAWRYQGEGPDKLKFIIVGINYFTKWIEAKPLAKTTARLGREIVGWVDELPNILWAHRTMLETSNGETPFSLTYGSEAVIPAEIGMSTYQTIHFNELQNEEETRLNLDLSQVRRETTAIREAKYKKKVEQYYNKKVRPMSFKIGDFVYRKNAASRVVNQGKLGSS